MTEAERATQFFTSSNPAVASVPNIVTHLDSDLLNAIVGINGAKPGVWNAGAPYDEDDRYQPFREGLPLNAWALAYNQGELLTLAGYSNTLVYGNDALIVDCTADEKSLALLEQMENARGEQGYQDSADIPKVLQRIGWALIPVGPERNFGLFVTSDANRSHVAMLQDWCHARGRTFYRLAMMAGVAAMPTFPAPDESRARAIQEQGLQFIARLAQLGIAAEEIQTHLPPVLNAAIEFEKS